MKDFLILTVLMVAFSAAIFFAGYSKGQGDYQAKAANSALKEINDNAKHIQKVRRLDDDDLVRRYCASSVFDVSTDECVRSNPLIR